MALAHDVLCVLTCGNIRQSFWNGGKRRAFMNRNLLERARHLAAKKTVWLFMISGLLALWPAPLQGLGVRTPNQDPEAIGRGNAFAATANNPSALYYNPAGITQLPGHNIQLGLYNYLG